MLSTEKVPVRFPRWIDRGSNLREVHPGLFVGDMNAPLQARDWGLIVDLCGALRMDPMGRRRYPANAEIISICLEDGAPIPGQIFERVYERVKRSLLDGEGVLLHCAAGLSRSVSMAYAILRVGRGMSHDEALSMVVTPEGTRLGYPMPETLRSAMRWSERRRAREGRKMNGRL